jgi:RHS repeat-associated protein
VYDGSNVYADFTSGGALTQTYLFGPAVDEILARTNASGLTTRWYLTDKRGSIRDVADNIGDVLDHVVYDSFGQVVTETSAPDGDRFKYAAMQYDGGSIKVYYDRARSYDPSTGRFLQEDPLGLSGGDANVYRYVGNSPTNFTDPTGLYYVPGEGGPGNNPDNGGDGGQKQPQDDCCCCCCCATPGVPDVGTPSRAAIIAGPSATPANPTPRAPSPGPAQEPPHWYDIPLAELEGFGAAFTSGQAADSFHGLSAGMYDHFFGKPLTLFTGKDWMTDAKPPYGHSDNFAQGQLLGAITGYAMDVAMLIFGKPPAGIPVPPGLIDLPPAVAPGIGALEGAAGALGSARGAISGAACVGGATALINTAMCMTRGLGSGPAANCPPEIEGHHLLPLQFEDRFRKVGLDPGKFRIPLPKDVHRLKPGGIHAGPREDSWNGCWKKFFEQNRNPSLQDVLDQLSKMRGEFGI